MAELRRISKYPVKGLAGFSLASAELTENKGIVGDRQFALTVEADVDGSHWNSSRSYLINAVNDGLLKIKPDRSPLEIRNQDLPDQASKLVSTKYQPRQVERTYSMRPTGFWDYPDSQLSVMNLETLRACSNVLNHTLSMDRFRGNLIIDDLPPWEELGLAGWRYQIGEAEVEFTRPVRRCAATQVNPETGERDLPVNTLLADAFEHGYFGVYACVCKSGQIRLGDRLIRLKAADLSRSDAMVQGSGPYQLWPKLADLDEVSIHPDQIELVLRPVGAWPLSEPQATGNMKLHLNAQNTIRASIIRSSQDSLTVGVPVGTNVGPQDFSMPRKMVVSGPYRKAAS